MIDFIQKPLPLPPFNSFKRYIGKEGALGEGGGREQEVRKRRGREGGHSGYFVQSHLLLLVQLLKIWHLLHLGPSLKYNTAASVVLLLYILDVTGNGEG